MTNEQRGHIEATIATLARMLQQLEPLIDAEEPSPEALMATESVARWLSIAADLRRAELADTGAVSLCITKAREALNGLTTQWRIGR